MAAFGSGTVAPPMDWSAYDAEYWQRRAIVAESEVRRLNDRLEFALILGKAVALKGEG